MDSQTKFIKEMKTKVIKTSVLVDNKIREFIIPWEIYSINIKDHYGMVSVTLVCHWNGLEYKQTFGVSVEMVSRGYESTLRDTIVRALILFRAAYTTGMKER